MSAHSVDQSNQAPLTLSDTPPAYLMLVLEKTDALSAGVSWSRFW
jgi:hypothetical protein